ncbi:MAG: TAXI family TRAP transporter solute-binding subunit [Desulfobacteraceae bacterium]|nr:TAXI family TRAP transporter solute-binding subunit [Desulfobacteraceae bacterium]
MTIFFIFIFCAIFSYPAMAKQEKKQITIGTGSKSGVYYQAGRAIARIAKTNSTTFSFKVLSTAGSIFNLENVHQGALDIGVAQSDWQFHAVNGSAPEKFKNSPYKNIRALFSLHGEPFTVVARSDAQILNFSDLKGRRVNIGSPGSGQRATMEVVMDTMGWTKSSFSLVEELRASEQSFALCNDRIQAMIYTVGHPNASVGKAIRLCDARIIPVTGSAIDLLVKQNPYYSYSDIPAHMYSNMPEPVKTFGVRATVVTSTHLDQDTVYTLVKTIFENMDDFKKLHPAFQVLQPKNMVKDGISAPLHEGAQKYYREKNLL